MTETKINEEVVEIPRAIHIKFGEFEFEGALVDFSVAIEIIRDEFMPVLETSTKMTSKYLDPGSKEDYRRWD